jgi:hypothetical protein
MLRAAEHAVDDTSVGIVARIVENDLGWLFTRSQAREYGIDGFAEVVTGGFVTGRLLALRGIGRRDTRQTQETRGAGNARPPELRRRPGGITRVRGDLYRLPARNPRTSRTGRALQLAQISTRG